MSTQDDAEPGSILWFDLTSPDADTVRDFYGAVVGWTASEVPMDGYSDYAMQTPSGKTVAGICHERGVNAGLPVQWLLYITVADLEASLAACRERGGEVLHGPRELGEDRFAVIRDPAGAVAGLYQKG